MHASQRHMIEASLTGSNPFLPRSTVYRTLPTYQVAAIARGSMSHTERNDAIRELELRAQGLGR